MGVRLQTLSPFLNELYMPINVAESVYSKDGIDLFGSSFRDIHSFAAGTRSICVTCESVSSIDWLDFFFLFFLFLWAVCRVSTKSVCLVISLTGPRANKTLVEVYGHFKH